MKKFFVKKTFWLLTVCLVIFSFSGCEAIEEFLGINSDLFDLKVISNTLNTINILVDDELMATMSDINPEVLIEDITKGSTLEVIRAVDSHTVIINDGSGDYTEFEILEDLKLIINQDGLTADISPL